jgi:hypothetical protein
MTHAGRRSMLRSFSRGDDDGGSEGSSFRTMHNWCGQLVKGHAFLNSACSEQFAQMVHDL